MKGCKCGKKNRMPWWMFKQYLAWKRANRIPDNVNKEEEWEWKFKKGDVVPKQGFSNNFKEYIQDAACKVDPNRRMPRMVEQIRDPNVKVRTQFGITWSC